MAHEPLRVRDGDAPQPERDAGLKTVGIIPDADPRAHALRMRMARCAAFFALSMPTQPTGTPGGTCTVAYSASTPLSGPTANGTPITGRSVIEAAKPGSAADSPAPAITTRK